MSTELTWQTKSISLENTAQLAESIGKRLRGGEVIELTSDVGGGKTTFVRSLASGMGSSDPVASPSFTISREYRAGDLMLHHYDFYRLSEAGLMAAELGEVLQDPQSIVVVEWGELVAGVLPAERLTIQIVPTGETSRQFIFTCPQKFGYLKGNA